MEKRKKVRIAIRETATELTRPQMELVAGGGPNDEQKGPVCDLPTDCWVDGGNFVFFDD